MLLRSALGLELSVYTFSSRSSDLQIHFTYGKSLSAPDRKIKNHVIKSRLNNYFEASNERVGKVPVFAWYSISITVFHNHSLFIINAATHSIATPSFSRNA